MSTEFISPNWRMPRNANQGKTASYSLSFDGVDDYVDLGTSLGDSLGVYNGSLTISLWYKHNANAYNHIFNMKPSDQHTHGELTILNYNSGSDNVIYCQVNQNTGAAYKIDYTTTYDTNWHHLVFKLIYDSSAGTFGLELYIDGISVGTVSGTPVPTTGTIDFTNGSTFIGGGVANRYYNGSIDIVAIFNYALSSSQITTLYGNSTNGPGNPMALPNTPIAYYPLGKSAWNGNFLVENNAIGDYVFDFTADNILFNTLNLGTQSTESFWVKRTTLNSNLWLGRLGPSGSSQGGYPLYLSTSIIYTRITTAGGFKQISFSTPNDTWMHICRVRNGNNVSVYVSYNGTFNQNSGTNNFTAFTGLENEDTIISEFTGNVGNTFEANNWQFFNTALSVTDVETLYNYGSPIQTLASIPQSSNLKAWYKLDASEIYNSSSTEWSIDNNAYPSSYISSLDFDPNASIDTNFTLPNYSSYSYSFWIKNTGSTSGSDQWILGNSSASVSGDRGFRGAVRINNSTKIRIFGGDDTNYYQKQYDFTAGNAQGNTNIFDGEWYNIVVTFTSGTIVFYVNGVAQTQEWNTNTPITGFAANNSYKIGQSGINTGYLNHSLLSNVQIFNTELSAPNAVTLYNNGTPLTDMSSFSSLVSWYKLNNTTTGIGNALSPYSTSLKFNTTPADIDFVEFGDLTTLATPATDFTFSIWLKVNNIGNTGGRYGWVYSDKSGSIELRPGTGISVKYEVTMRGMSSSDKLVSTQGSAEYTQWHHLAITLSGSSAKMYFNGALVDTGTAGSATNFGEDAQMARLQAAKTNNFYGFEGNISNFAIFNSELSAPQISTLFNLGTPEANTSFSPIHNWKLDNLTTGLNDTGSLASNNGTAGSVNGTAPLVELGDVSTSSGTNNGATEQIGFVNSLASNSSGMSQSNLVQSDLQTVAPYSKYSLYFSGINDRVEIPNLTTFFNGNNIFSISCWVKRTTNTGTFVCAWGMQGGGAQALYAVASGDSLRVERGLTTDVYISNFFPLNEWVNLTTVFDSSTNVKIYKNGSFIQDVTVSATATYASNIKFYIGNGINGSYGLRGNVSNLAIWNSALTASQVREIYNQGLPSNLNSHSAYSNLVSWWQLGENSSFDGNDWICADEKGTNNGESNNVAVDALTNGVGTTANGTSSGMAQTAIVSSAPNSTGNAMSFNMGSTAKGTNVP